MWISEKIIEKYESGSDWKYDLAVLRGQCPGERRIKQHRYTLNDDLYQECGHQELLKELQILEKRGFIKVKWYQYGSYATEFTYQLADIPEFYRIQDKVPKPRTVHKQLEYVENYLNRAHKSWIIQVFEKERRQILEGRAREEERDLQEFYQCLLGLDQLQAPVFKRVFSKQYLNNSKRLEERYQGRIVSAARKYLESIDEEMNDSQVLSELYIEEYAQELAVKGPLHLLLEGRHLSLEEFRYGVVLNSETLEKAQVEASQPIHKVITIENKANFVSVPYEEGTLYVFSHGFFSPKEREFLLRLRNMLDEDTGYYHSGDLDYGGLRIFRYIRDKIFPKLKPWMMHAEIYRQYEKYGETMPESIRRKLEQLKDGWDELNENPELEEIRILIDEMIRSGYVLEQEAFLIRQNEQEEGI